MRCPGCGNIETGRFCGVCGVAMTSAVQGGAFRWPFFQPSWGKSLWMPLLWAVPLGNFLSAGWSLEAVRRRSAGARQLLPQPEDIAAMFARGFAVYFFWFFYFAIPLLVIGWICGWAWLEPIWQLIVQLYDIATHKPHEPFISFLVGRCLVFLTDASAPLVYVAVAGPLFLAAQLRYAETGRASSFLRLIANTWFCMRHIGDMLRYFFFASLLRIALAFLAVLLLAVPVIGQLLPFVLVTLGIWTRAYWAGEIGAKLHAERYSESPVGTRKKFA